jgi:hypothetical protein
MSIPIACSLSESELRERQRTVIDELRSHVRQVIERPDGYALDLTPTDEAIVAATTFIRLERRCCPFLRFTLTIEPGDAQVVLALTGDPGVRDFLAPWGALPVAAPSGG